MTHLSRAVAWLTETVERLRSGRSSVRLVAVALLIGSIALGAIGLAGSPPSVSSPDQATGPASVSVGSTSRDDGSSVPVTGLGGTPDLGLGGTLDSGLGRVLDMAGKGVLVLVMLLLTLRLLNRMSSAGGSAAAHLVVLESRPLAQRASLHLVAVGDRRLVVGLTPSGLVPLAELTADELPDPAATDGANRPVTGVDLGRGGPIEGFARVAADLARRGGIVR
ncbi:MAG: hypothetical protein C0498_05075 [Anaerolinea sp.]|nr:hypothetical protein [Anaerolinea sp.]